MPDIALPIDTIRSMSGGVLIESGTLDDAIILSDFARRPVWYGDMLVGLKYV